MRNHWLKNRIKIEDFKLISYSNLGCVYEVNHPKIKVLHFETLEPIPLKTRIVIHPTNGIRTIWSPDKDHSKTVLAKAKELLTMLSQCESLVDHFMNKPGFRKFEEQDRRRFIIECMKIWQDRRSKGQDLRFPYENGCFEEGYGESQYSELLEEYGFNEG